MLKKMNMLMVLVACPVWAMAEESSTSTFPGEVSGNIAVLSSYNLRGITNSPENNKATLQAGIEYSCISHLKSAMHFTTKSATLKEWRFHQKIQFFSSSLH